MDTLPSAVSLIREKTVYYLKCHSRGFEKVMWPILCIAILLCSIILLAVACGTQNWIQLTVQNNATEQRGNITLGLLRGSSVVRYRESPISNFINSSYYLFDKFHHSYLARIYTTFVLSLLAIVSSLLNLAVTLYNSYQSVTSWWKGPSMMYLLSLFTSVCGITAFGVFLDHYSWYLNTNLIFTNTTTLPPGEALTFMNRTFNSFEYLINEEGYRSIPSLHFSFGLHVAGACLPLLVTLLAWRLALLIPPCKLEIETKQTPMQDIRTTQFMTSENQVTTIDPILSYQEPTDLHLTSSPIHAFPREPAGERPSGIAISPVHQKEVFY